MKLAAALGTAKSGGLIMAAITHAFTISYLANHAKLAHYTCMIFLRERRRRLLSIVQ